MISMHSIPAFKEKMRKDIKGSIVGFRVSIGALAPSSLVPLVFFFFHNLIFSFISDLIHSGEIELRNLEST